MIKIYFAFNRGKKHDAAMLVESHLYNSLRERNAFSKTGEAMCIYGDPAYPLRIHLQAPFRNRVLTAQMLAYNSSRVLFVLLLSGCFGKLSVISNV